MLAPHPREGDNVFATRDRSDTSFRLRLLQAPQPAIRDFELERALKA